MLHIVQRGTSSSFLEKNLNRPLIDPRDHAYLIPHIMSEVQQWFHGDNHLTPIRRCGITEFPLAIDVIVGFDVEMDVMGYLATRYPELKQGNILILASEESHPIALQNMPSRK